MRRALLAAWLLGAVCTTPAGAQQLPPKGDEATLDVATWNIEHFGNDGSPPNDETQIENAAEVIRRADVDLWALQEIEDLADFETLIGALGEGWSGAVDRQSTNAHVAYIYKTDVIRPRQIVNRLTNYAHEFAGRPPLLLEADVTLPDTTFVASFITLHMKAFDDQSSYERRLEASRRLKNHIDFTVLNAQPVIVLGDFNDELTSSITSGRPSPYQNFIDDPDDFSFVTLGLENNNENTWCRSGDCQSGSTIDHILITDEFFDAYVSASASTYEEVLDTQNGIRFYTSTTSDHLPVFARFRFSGSTSSAPVPDAFLRYSLYPNPSNGRASLDVEVGALTRVSLTMHDVLGRLVRAQAESVLPAGKNRLGLDLEGMPNGTYFIRLASGGTVSVTALTISR